MDDALLAAYFDEHLAGAAVAIEIAERLADDDEIQTSIVGLLDELDTDRAVLEEIRSRLPVGENVVKRTLGLVGGILAQLRERSPLGSPPPKKEDLEALAVGIWGKRLLWGTVARVALHDERFGDLDVGSLARRAEEQEKTLLRLRADATESELELARHD